MSRLLLPIVVVGLLLAAACQSAQTPAPTAAPKTEAKPAETKPAASPIAAGSPAAKASPVAAGSPAAKPSPSPSPAAGATGAGDEGILGTSLSTNGLLSIIGIVLTAVIVVAWIFSNRAEATPNVDQLQEMRHFVRDHFARYVAHGLAAEGVDPPSIAHDSAWRKIYLQHLRLHNELYAFRRDVALQVYEQEIDAAVREQVQAVRAAGQRANPAVAE